MNTKNKHFFQNFFSTSVSEPLLLAARVGCDPVVVIADPAPNIVLGRFGHSIVVFDSIVPAVIITTTSTLKMIRNITKKMKTAAKK